jgi:hypothetical protein
MDRVDIEHEVDGDDPPAVHNDLARFPWHNITMALGKKSNHSHMLLERELDARLTSRMSEHIGKRIARVEGHEDRRDDESLTADRYRHTFEVIRGRHRSKHAPTHHPTESTLIESEIVP